MVGPEKQKQDSEELLELKKKHKRRKDHASERQKKLVKEIKKWEGEGKIVFSINAVRQTIICSTSTEETLEKGVKCSELTIDFFFFNWDSLHARLNSH